MYILGINYHYHDTSACLVNDGELLVALEQERFSRVKHTREFPSAAIERCLDVAGIGPNDLDLIAVSVAPLAHLGGRVGYAVRSFGVGARFAFAEATLYQTRRAQFQRWLARLWPDKRRRPRVTFVEHHLSHVAGSFLVSPYEEAALLGMDGSGEWATSYLGKGQGKSCIRYQQSFFPMSIGSFYEAVTEFVGFRPNHDEGKTMGLAPFGDPSVYYKPVSEILRVGPEGQIEVDLSYFRYQDRGTRCCGPKFFETFGQPRHKDEEISRNHKDVAAAFQKVLEDRALELCAILKRKSGCRHLVLAGGVALNSVMNGRLVRESEFDDIYVMAGAGDNGTSIGAAYYAYNVTLGRPRSFVHLDAYVGNEYSDAQIRRTIEACNLPVERHENISAIAADLLAEQRMLGWFQGRMEFGPRALGNRSILANPTVPHMKDTLNARVKHREAFRPFAPSVPVERKDDFFESSVEAPFMLKVCPVRADQREKLPAVTHVDGSARIHTVRGETNAIFHRLLCELDRRIGAPVVLNTSFNIMGEPIVESPIQAIRCFFSTGLDDLILGNYVVRKQRPNGR